MTFLLLFLFTVYCIILYIFYIIDKSFSINHISEKAWANPFKYLYLEIFKFITFPFVLPVKFLITSKRNFTKRVATARQNILKQEVYSIANDYNLIYEKEKVCSYLRRNIQSSNSDIKLFRDYLHKEKDQESILTVEDIYSFHKHGWY